MEHEHIDIAPVTRMTLLQAVRDDPASARWGEFYGLYHPFLMRCLAKYAWIPREDKEEVVNDVFLDLMRSLSAYGDAPDRCRFRQYIQTKLHGKLVDRIRRNTKLSRTGAARQVLVEHGEEIEGLTFEEIGERMNETLARYAEWAVRAIETPESVDDSPDDAVALVRVLLDATFAAGRFSGQSRRIFERLAFEGASAHELAEEYGMKENAVNQLKHRVVKAMKERFADARRQFGAGDFADIAEFLRAER